MVEIKKDLQKTKDLQRKKSELYVRHLQKANKLKVESYNLHLKVADLTDKLMRAQFSLIKKTTKSCENN